MYLGLICVVIVYDVTYLNAIDHLRKMTILVRLPHLVKKSVQCRGGGGGGGGGGYPSVR